MSPAADLTVVVLTWNTRALTLRALRAVPAACAPLRPRIVCVDNASADGTVEAVARELPHVELVVSPSNVGFARGNNLALSRLEGRAVLFLNSDTDASPGSLAHVVRRMDANPRIGAACPRLVHADGSDQRAAWGEPTALALLHETTPLGWLGLGRGAADRARPPRGADAADGPVEVASGACLVVRRDLCERLRGFDEGYPFYFEDVDLCARVREAGYEVHVVLDGPPVLHHGGASSALTKGALRLPFLVGGLRLQRRRLSAAAFVGFSVLYKAGAVARSLIELLRAPVYATVRRLRGRSARAARTWRTAAERARFLERDVLPFLRAEVGLRELSARRGAGRLPGP